VTTTTFVFITIQKYVLGNPLPMQETGQSTINCYIVSYAKKKTTSKIRVL
jgi:hypothetical protein